MPSEHKLRILLLGLNYAPEIVGIAVYTSGLAEALADRGHEVRVVAGKPYYPGWSVPPAFRGGWLARTQENGVAVTRVAHYVPVRPTGSRRLLHHAAFAASSFAPLLRDAWVGRPDVILTVAPSLIAAPAALAARALTGAKTWLHVQDFEVDAAFATGLVPSRGCPGRLARGFERRVLGAFDRVSSISPTMCARLAQKGVEPSRIREFRNWADIDSIRPLAGPSSFRREWGIATPHVALYSGNIANKQGIDIVVEAARLLRHRPDLTFVICGQGPNLAGVEAQARGLGNVMIRDLQPKARLGDLLGLATVHLLPQIAGAADLVLPSKLTNMLASGRAIVATAASGTGLAHEMEGCGHITPPGDVPAFAQAIERLLDDAPARAQYDAQARLRAEERWNRERIISQLEEELLKLALSVQVEARCQMGGG